MAEKDDFARAGEQRAAEYLAAKGMTILDRNWRCAFGEIDVVAVDGDALVFVEVKSRRTMSFGDPLAAVDQRKQSRLRRLMMQWVHDNSERTSASRIRLDVVAILGVDPVRAEIEHLQDLR